MAKKGKKPTNEPEIVNRRARHEYLVHDTLEVGIALRGPEVKSVREGKVSLGEGYVRAEAEPVALTLHGVTIDAYGPAAGSATHASARPRVLLAHKREILKLAKDSSSKGTTIIPLKIYFKNGRAKLLIGLAQGKGRFDKREDLKKRDAARDIQRAMSRRV
ncbi:MAG: SsrA-binding protein SmpB [Phycisphaerales bacterium]|nr:MAG: SsrA-binding protein SmpB [Phycisphaerales bacterium]